MPRGKTRPFINKKKAVTFAVLPRSASDVLAGDVDQPQNVLQPLRGSGAGGAFGDVMGGHNDGDEDYDEEDGEEYEEDEEYDEEDEEDDLEDDDTALELGFAPDDGYDYNQHLKSVGDRVDGGFSVFVSRDGKVIPAANIPSPGSDTASTSTSSPANNNNAPVADERIRIDKKSLKAHDAELARPNAYSQRMNLDPTLFAQTSRVADEEAAFVSKFGHLDFAQIDQSILDELEEVANAASDQDEDFGLADDFVLQANQSDAEGDEYGDSGDDEEYGDDLDIDVDDDLDSATTLGSASTKKTASSGATVSSTKPTKSTAARGPTEVPEHLAMLEAKFKRELEIYDDTADLDEQDPRLLEGTVDIANYESVLDEFLEEEHKRKQQTLYTMTGGSLLNKAKKAHQGEGEEEEDDEDDDDEGEEDEEVEDGDSEPEDAYDGTSASDSEDDALDLIYVKEKDPNEQQWDAESILKNHPAVLDAPQKRKKMQIKVNAQGVPMGVLTGRPSKQQQQKQKEEEEIERRNNGEARQKNETKEERRERKKALKEERRSNRQRKKDLKVAYKSAQLGAHAELIKPQQRTSVMHY